MKKSIKTILITGMMLTLTACSTKEQNTDAVQNTETVTEVSEQTEGKQETTEAASASAEELDLTVMSSTMIFAEVYNMMLAPDNYDGRTVKMKGQFSVLERNDETYYACVIADATSCCAQGIEFILSGDYQYPEDFPEAGSIITVEGTFDAYDKVVGDGTIRFGQVIDASLQV